MQLVGRCEGPSPFSPRGARDLQFDPTAHNRLLPMTTRWTGDLFFPLYYIEALPIQLEQMVGVVFRLGRRSRALEADAG